MKHYTILMVDNDMDDVDFLKNAFSEINPNLNIIHFNTAADAISYLIVSVEERLLILSNIDLPGISGLEFKRQMNSDKNLNSRKIPFIFLTSNNNPVIIKEAYSLGIQGYFQKPDNITDFDLVAKTIIDYWVTRQRIGTPAFRSI